MADRGNERDDSRGGIGLGGPQAGPIGGDDRRQQKGETAQDTPADTAGAGSQRHPGGSSRDSEKLA